MNIQAFLRKACLFSKKDPNFERFEKSHSLSRQHGEFLQSGHSRQSWHFCLSELFLAFSFLGVLFFRDSGIFGLFCFVSGFVFVVSLWFICSFLVFCFRFFSVFWVLWCFVFFLVLCGVFGFLFFLVFSYGFLAAVFFRHSFGFLNFLEFMALLAKIPARANIVFATIS